MATYSSNTTMKIYAAGHTTVSSSTPGTGTTTAYTVGSGRYAEIYVYSAVTGNACVISIGGIQLLGANSSFGLSSLSTGPAKFVLGSGGTVLITDGSSIASGSITFSYVEYANTP